MKVFPGLGLQTFSEAAVVFEAIISNDSNGRSAGNDAADEIVCRRQD